MQHLRPRLALLSILILLAAALLAACSSSGDQAQQQAQPQAQEAQEAQEAAQPQPVAVQTPEAEQQEQPAAAQQPAEAQEAQPQPAPAAQQQEQQQTAAAAEPAEQQQAQQQAQQQEATPEPPAEQQQQAQPAPPPAQQQEQQAAPPPPPPAQEQEQQAEPEPVEEQQEEQEEEAGPPPPSELDLRAADILAQATAPELTGLNGWLNGEETTIARELAKGNIVLIDFWTYTCINCVRTLPFLTAWDDKYREHGLIILGVHTPEFEFEKIPANILGAIAEYNIQYDVPIDNDYRTWRAFRNRYWPAKYLIGPTDDGSPMGVRYYHFGEGDYDETEHQIRAALEAVGRDLSDVPFGVDVTTPERQNVGVRQTRELYAGWSRNAGSGGPYAGQEEYFLNGRHVPYDYTDIPTDQREHNRWYLQGLWTTEQQAIVHARETSNLEDYIALLVRGRTTNVVLTVAEDGRPYDVYVQIDDRWVNPLEAGAHIQYDEAGRSFIRVTENDLYRLLYLPEWSEHELKLSSNSDQFRIFAFTFGSYVGGE